MRRFLVRRLFELKQFSNLTLEASVELSEEDKTPAAEIFKNLIDEIYTCYFEHDIRLKETNAGQTMLEKREIFFKKESTNG